MSDTMGGIGNLKSNRYLNPGFEGVTSVAEVGK